MTYKHSTNQVNKFILLYNDKDKNKTQFKGFRTKWNTKFVEGQNENILNVENQKHI